MDENKSRTQFGIDMNSVGIFLFCIYIFVSYLANDVLLPSTINTYALYFFLGYSVLYVLKNMKLRVHLTTVWMAVFMVYSLMTMTYSPEKNVFSGTFYFLIVNFILVLVLSQYTINLKTIEFIGITYSVSAFTLVTFLMATGNIIDTSATGRLGQNLLGNANILATMLMTATLYTMWLLVFLNCNKIKRTLLLLCLVAEYLGLFLSGGRKYIVVPIIFLYILLLLKQDNNGRKHILKYTVIIVALVAIIWNLIMKTPIFYEIIGSRMESFLSFLYGDISNADESSMIRSQMIHMGLEAFPESPFFGHGFDSFKFMNYRVTGHQYYSHNNFIELLYNMGIVGFVLYYWYYARLFFMARSGKKDVSLSAKAFSIAMIFSMLSYEYGAINYTTTSTMIMMYLAYVLLNTEV